MQSIIPKTQNPIPKPLPNSPPCGPGAKITVVGLGVSGLWTARWLGRQGAGVTVSEIRSEQELDQKALEELRDTKVTLETGGHKEETFLGADLIIVSPGVPHDMPLLREAIQRGVRVMGELEFASRLIQTPIIAVTGTNGKTTVTEFVGLMLRRGGLECFVGGNIGTPLMAYVAGEQQADYLVIEVSSFQLDTIETFCPFISVILNVSPDHLDRYSSYQAYVESKLRIFENQGAGSYLILNDDDPTLSATKPSTQVSVLRYGIEKKEGRHAVLDGKQVKTNLNDTEDIWFSLESFGLLGGHNLENLLGSVLVGLEAGLSPGVIQAAIEGFKGLPHRLEKVGEFDKVLFYNDSKATNVDAAVKAVQSLDRCLILIAGGRDKGADYGPLVRASKGRVRGCVFLGEARELLAKSFDGVIPYSMAGDMEEAVSRAFSIARPEDVVLLAPACSSFDMFSDYSHRGRVFRRAVEKLVHG